VPIMGVGYYRTMSQWSKGEYAEANNPQQQISMLTALAGVAPNTPTVLQQSTSTQCSGIFYNGSSVIRTVSDVDDWVLTTSAPAHITISAIPWYSSWDPLNYLYNGNNLDINLSFQQNNNPASLISSDPPGDPEASITTSQPAGGYTISVTGGGDPGLFSSYSSLGQYSISVCVTPSSVACTSGPCCDVSAGTFVSAGTVCQAKNPNNPCDLNHVCLGDSSACPVRAAPSTTLCRPSAGPCDTPEYCPGSTNDSGCPPDSVYPRGYVCHAATSLCDEAEYCDGTSVTCPADQVAPYGTICRPILGVCDQPVLCTGTSNVCPTTRTYFIGATCRQASGPCDLAEVCTNSPNCPADTTVPNGATCSLGTSIGVCEAGVCSPI